MKILYICGDVDVPVLGSEGSSIHVREFANALADLGHDVSVLAAWGGGGNSFDRRVHLEIVEPQGPAATAWTALESEPVIERNLLWRDFKSVLLNEWLVKRGAAAIQDERPRFIYERYSMFGWSGLSLSKELGIPLVLEVNTPLSQEQDGYDQFTLTHLAGRMEQVLLESAHHVIAVSSVVADWVSRRGGRADRITVIPNAVSISQFERVPDGSAVRERLGLTKRPVVGFVGSFQQWHDVSGLIRAFARAHEHCPNAQLLLVGDGPRRGELVALCRSLKIEPYVTFAGSMAHENIPQYIGAMDIAVAPYAKMAQPFYGSPLKVFEYMAAARPTIGAGVGQVAEVINHLQTGWLYEAGNDDALSSVLLDLLLNPTRAAAIGRAARLKVLQEHTWRAVADQVIQKACK